MAQLSKQQGRRLRAANLAGEGRTDWRRRGEANAPLGWLPAAHQHRPAARNPTAAHTRRPTDRPDASRPCIQLEVL